MSFDGLTGRQNAKFLVLTCVVATTIFAQDFKLPAPFATPSPTAINTTRSHDCRTGQRGCLLEDFGMGHNTRTILFDR
jgi:hypothetical protein